MPGLFRSKFNEKAGNVPFSIECVGIQREMGCECGEGKQGGECLNLLGEPVEGVRVDRVDLVVVQRQPGHLTITHSDKTSTKPKS